MFVIVNQIIIFKNTINKFHLNQKFQLDLAIKTIITTPTKESKKEEIYVKLEYINLAL